ncbi:MAG: hypothetical protein MHM6MM_000961 [Cercozoa sp. M6MM]
MGRRKNKRSGVKRSKQAEVPPPSEGYDSDASDLCECEHVSRAVRQQQVERVLTKVKKGKKALNCKSCSTAKLADLRLCAHCGVFACEEHADEHVRNHSHHALWVTLETQETLCAVCAVPLSQLGFSAASHPRVHHALEVIADRVCKVLQKQLRHKGARKHANKTSDDDDAIIGELDLSKVRLIEGNSSCLRGLVNCGNTCFFNSVMQCLAKTAPLLQALREASEGGRMAKVLTHFLLQEYYGVSGKGPVRPSTLLREVARVDSSFRVGRQQDAHELLRLVLSAMQDEWQKRRASLLQPLCQQRLSTLDSDQLDAVCQAICREDSQSDGDTWLQVALGKTKESAVLSHLNDDAKALVRAFLARCKSGDLLQRDIAALGLDVRLRESVISRVFGGTAKSTTECLACSHVSEVKEVYSDLSLSLSTQVTLPRSSKNHKTHREKEDENESEFAAICRETDAPKVAKIARLKSVLPSDEQSELSDENCLVHFCAPEVLCNDEKYVCENCTKHVASLLGETDEMRPVKRDAIRRTLLSAAHLPQILTLHFVFTSFFSHVARGATKTGAEKLKGKTCVFVGKRRSDSRARTVDCSAEASDARAAEAALAGTVVLGTCTRTIGTCDCRRRCVYRRGAWMTRRMKTSSTDSTALSFTRAACLEDTTWPTSTAA